MTTLARTLADSLTLGMHWAGLQSGRVVRRSRPPSTQRQLALLAWALPPASNAGVYRPLSFLRHGTALGWQIQAFHGHVPGNQSQHGAELRAQVPATVGMHLVEDEVSSPSYRLFPRIDGSFKSAVAFARRVVEHYRDEPPDAILASGPPFFVFVAGLLASRRLGAPLILDYRDEWSECPFDFVDKGPDDRRWEERCQEAAAAVLFTTESHRMHQLAKFPKLDAAKTHLVPNGWEPEDFAAPAGTAKAMNADGHIVISHVGNLAGHTPPDAFLSAVAELAKQSPWRERLRIRLIGRRSADAEAAIRRFPHPQMLEVIDHVSKREAAEAMSQSDLLLLIATPDLERYMPGKLFDYAASGRPIIVFGSAGEAAQTVQKLCLGELCAVGDPQALGEAIGRLQRHDPTPASRAALAHWLDEHQRNALAKRAFFIIDTVAGRT